MSNFRRQPFKRLASIINHPENILKKSFLLLTIAGIVALFFSSWGAAPGNTDNNVAARLAITTHQLRSGNTALIYKATTGYMPLVDKNNKPVASLFMWLTLRAAQPAIADP